MPTTWIVQTNVEPTSRSPGALRRACGALGLPLHEIAIDVARVDRTFRVVECNCFNGSGFYAADAERLVHAVSAFQESRER